MTPKVIYWIVATVALLVAGGALYYSLDLPLPSLPTIPGLPQPSAPATAPPTLDTTSLDQEATKMEADLKGLETEISDFSNVNPAQDDLGI
jgi:hypothetical protein